MSHILDEAIAAYVRGKLKQKEVAELPGIGTITVAHETARDRVVAKGGTGIFPPKDTIRFTPEALT